MTLAGSRRTAVVEVNLLGGLIRATPDVTAPRRVDEPDVLVVAVKRPKEGATASASEARLLSQLRSEIERVAREPLPAALLDRAGAWRLTAVAVEGGALDELGLRLAALAGVDRYRLVGSYSVTEVFVATAFRRRAPARVERPGEGVVQREDSEDELGVRRRCGLYRPGHEVHWVQALGAMRRLDTEPPIVGRLAGWEQNGTITLDIGGKVERVWNHEPNRLAGLALRVDSRVSLQPGWGLLRVESSDGHYLFYVGDPVDHLECPGSPPTGDPLDLLAQTGGFSIPAGEALRHLDGKGGR